MPSIRALAEKQAAQLAALEHLGTPFVRAYVTDMERRALAAVQSGGKVKLSKAEIQKAVDELADFMLLGFVRRYRQKKQSLGIELNLSFSRDVKKISRGLDLDLDGIRDSLATTARERVAASLSTMEERINDALHVITSRQQTTRVATNQMRRKLDDMGLSFRNPSMAETLVRTHAQLAFGAAQYQLNQDDPHDVIWGYVYATVGDDRVRPEHAMLDGLTREKDDPIWKTLWPPNGWNCVPSGTLVSGRIDGASRMAYRGPLIEIRTVHGRRLAVTPNHRVATPAGFRAAHTLRHGDNLFDDRRFLDRFVPASADRSLPTIAGLGRTVNKNDRPAKIEDVFNSLAVGGARTVGAMLSPLNFHGDAQWSNGKVDVVHADRMLPAYAAGAEFCLQQLSKLGLQLAAQPANLIGGRLSGLDSFSNAALPSPATSPRRAALLLNYLAIVRALLANRPFGLLRLGPSADLDTCLRQPAGESSASDSECLRELLNRFAGRITLDKVSDIRAYRFDGHVYDLQCDTGYMIASGIIISNCRCQLIELTEPADVTKIPKGAAADDGFDFNPGQLLAA